LAAETSYVIGGGSTINNLNNTSMAMIQGVSAVNEGSNVTIGNISMSKMPPSEFAQHSMPNATPNIMSQEK